MVQPMSATQLLTSPQVASKLGCSPRTVHRLVESGELVFAQQLAGPNGAYLFDPGEVDAYIERTRASA